MSIIAIASLLLLVFFPSLPLDTTTPSEQTDIIDSTTIPNITQQQNQNISQTLNIQLSSSTDVTTTTTTENNSNTSTPPPELAINYSTDFSMIENLPAHCQVLEWDEILHIDCETITVRIAEPQRVTTEPFDIEPLLLQIDTLQQEVTLLEQQLHGQQIKINVLLEALRGIQIIIEDTLALFE